MSEISREGIDRSDYPSFLAGVLEAHDLSWRKHEGVGERMRRVYDFVRRIPYGGAGQRDPQLVYERNLGTCSGKHILLRDLLRSSGYKAHVATMFTHFNKGIPIHESMGPELQHIIADTEVPDFHHVVFVPNQAFGWLQATELDATWHDALRAYGFPVNDAWTGSSKDMKLAGEPIRWYPVVEDIVTQKKELLTTLSEEEIIHRARFLELLTEWIAEKEDYVSRK